MLRHQNRTAPLIRHDPQSGDPAWLADFPDWSWNSARAALHFLKDEPALRQEASLVLNVTKRPYGWDTQLPSRQIITLMGGPLRLITRDEANLMALRGQETPLGHGAGEVRERFVQAALQELISDLDIGNCGPCPVPLPTDDLPWAWQATLPTPILPAPTGSEGEDLTTLMDSALNLLEGSLRLALLTGHRSGWAVNAGQLAAISVSICPQGRLSEFVEHIPPHTGPFSATLSPDDTTAPLVLMGQWSGHRVALTWTP